MCVVIVVARMLELSTERLVALVLIAVGVVASLAAIGIFIRRRTQVFPPDRPSRPAAPPRQPAPSRSSHPAHPSMPSAPAPARVASAPEPESLPGFKQDTAAEDAGVTMMGTAPLADSVPRLPSSASIPLPRCFYLRR